MTKEEVIDTVKAVLNYLYNDVGDTWYGNLLSDVLEELMNNSDAESVKHGHWIKNEDRSGCHCSCCGKDDLYAYPYTENNERELQDFYCPNCGAKMDEVEDEESV